MRNLKRALSLTLASVMLLGMMVVGSSAAGYPDVSEEENIEAIEVLQSVGVMEGDNNGNFNPDDYVTREQMAVIMSKLLNLDYNYYQGTNPFSDVPAWAAPYVAACAANGITSGIGGGMYGAERERRPGRPDDAEGPGLLPVSAGLRRQLCAGHREAGHRGRPV